ncbi:MAG: acyl-CoA synthetase [Myxococcota bacterium]|nr:acyl-CoA synthetase [Spirochaeta sp.]RPG08610.1 MAG: acyl-CoA synthetase [Proteobacteria bacterium TMED72]
MNLGHVHEAIAEIIPERDCIVYGDKRFSWAETTDRTRRLAEVLRQHGLGCHHERDGLANWESGQDHVALYLYNGNEYLEGMLGAFKARCAPFNVNYRYVEEELLYLFDNADARAVIYHAAFAPTLALIRDKLSGDPLLIQVADGSGNPLLPGALDYEEALAAAEPSPPRSLSEDDLYILYTGGTTGMPKGVLWRQEDVFLGALTGKPPESLSSLLDEVRSREGIRALPTPPFMHGAAHWVAFNMWHIGGTVVIQDEVERLDPDDIWRTVERERVVSMAIVGDAFARPLIDQLRQGEYDLSSLRRVTSGGAIFTASLKQELLDLLPGVRILDALGSSESGAQAMHVSTGKTGASTGSFDLGPQDMVLADDLSHALEPGSEERGWLARSGRIPLGYYKDPEKSRITFPVVNGARYSVPGDRAMIGEDGRVQLLGRDSVTINSGGEKIFAEEVELALKHHPAVYDCVVCGTSSERWGSQVTAIVQLRPGESADEEALKATASGHISRYKLPKAFVFVDTVVRAPSGKADYRWARDTANEALDL